MPRAPKKCAQDGCETRVTARTHCDQHVPINWGRKGAGRTSTPGHRAWRTAVLSRDKGTCQIRGPQCIGRALEADHIVPVAEGGAELDLANGQAACVPCHKVKTQKEAARGRERARLGRHPG